MRPCLLLVLMLLKYLCNGQTKSNAETDFNTIFVCIDSLSYNNLFKNKYLKDTLFFCKESHQVTDLDSYVGKYLIGESATIEFFKPNNDFKIGNQLGDFGVEFKTRKLGVLDKTIIKSKTSGITADTSTAKIVIDSSSIPWYKALSIKNARSEFSILEYQPEYLDFLGFTTLQMRQSMTYKEFNNFISNGMKYPRQFSKVTRIKLIADQKMLLNLQKFAFLNNCKKKSNTFSNGVLTIVYEKVKKAPHFPIKEIELSLLNEQKIHKEKISENILLNIENKKAIILFSNYN